jgi:chromosomal replication initiation ATPase DnaA
MNNAVIYNNDNYNDTIQCEKNIFVDNFLDYLNEENLFHLINHCFNNDLKILLCTNKLISNYIFELKDLSSRLKSFNFIEIKKPDDELIVNLINKLLYDKQIIINNSEIFSYVLRRINRNYKDIYLLVDKIDKLSLEKKRELTVPLIKELI